MVNWGIQPLSLTRLEKSSFGSSLLSEEHMKPPFFIFQTWEEYVVSTILQYGPFCLFSERLWLLYSLDGNLVPY